MPWQLDPRHIEPPRERGRVLSRSGAFPARPSGDSSSRESSAARARFLTNSTQNELLAAQNELVAAARYKEATHWTDPPVAPKPTNYAGSYFPQDTQDGPAETRGSYFTRDTQDEFVRAARSSRDADGHEEAKTRDFLVVPEKPKSDLVVIHVKDEARKVSRDFACDRRVLLREMRYFRSYLGDAEGFEDLDISVHCDVHIFEWLVQWIHAPGKPPPLDASSVVSILISSEFLEMARLVDHCLTFMAATLQEILGLPIDLSCMSDALVQRLAQLCPADALSNLADPKAKLLPKLFKRRLELDFRHRKDAATTQQILKCRHCAALYPAWAQDRLPCPRAPPRIDRRGQLCTRHEPVLEKWSLTEHVGGLHAGGMPWEAVYWAMWGATHVFRCTACLSWFGAADLDECRYHAEPMRFDGDPLRGRYACCGAECRRFTAGATARGCAARRHAIDPTGGSATPATLTLLAKQGSALAAAAARDAEAPDERASSSEPSRAPTPVPPPEPAPAPAPPAPGRPGSQERPGFQEEAKPPEEKKPKGRRKGGRGAARKKLTGAVRKLGKVRALANLDLAAAAAKALADEAATKAAAERTRRLFSVFGAAPDGPAAPADYEHPLARASAPRKEDDAAALSPRRRRAYDMDCGWRLEDQERMGQLCQALIDRRTPLTEALARAADQDQEVKVEKKAEAKRWR